MKFSIVIPTCDRPEKLRECLRRVMAQAGGNEVIVTDDSRSAAMGKMPPGVQWVRGPRRGPAANRNRGALEAKGEWLIFLDDDCLPEEGWLAGYEVAASEEVDVLEGRTVCPMEDRFAFYEIVENTTGGLYWSCNLAVRRERFEGSGRFDEDFTRACAEDMELAWRMRGLRRRFVPGAVVTHPPRKMKASDLIKRTAAHRWVLLFRLKTGQAPGVECSGARAAIDLLVREYLDSLRMILQLGRESERIKGMTLAVLWRCVSLTAFMPYYLYWDLKWRKMLKGRVQVQV